MKRERNLTLSELINYMRKFDDECINRPSATEIYLNPKKMEISSRVETVTPTRFPVFTELEKFLIRYKTTT